MIKGPMPCLWFDDQAEAAAEFYTSVFDDSRIVQTAPYPKAAEAVSGKPAGSLMTVDIEIKGTRFQLLNGGPQFTFSEAVSFTFECDTQDEIDSLWDKLVEGGGEHGPCGWLKDRFGVSWQVVPSGWDELVQGNDPEAYERASSALFRMGKIDIAELRRAAGGATTSA